MLLLRRDASLLPRHLHHGVAVRGSQGRARVALVSLAGVRQVQHAAGAHGRHEHGAQAKHQVSATRFIIILVFDLLVLEWIICLFIKTSLIVNTTILYLPVQSTL